MPQQQLTFEQIRDGHLDAVEVGDPDPTPDGDVSCLARNLTAPVGDDARGVLCTLEAGHTNRNHIGCGAPAGAPADTCDVVVLAVWPR